MKRIGVLTAGGDTPALNATIHGVVTRANARRIEVYGLIKGFNSLFNPRLPHVHLNPLFEQIPELDPTNGGTLLGASRDYLNGSDTDTISLIADRLKQLGVDGLICVGGDGTLNGMQALSHSLPVVLAPKTIDNDLGLNYPGEVNEWRRAEKSPGVFCYQHIPEARAVISRTSSTTSRPDSPRPCLWPPAASSASGRRPRATGVLPSLKSWGASPGTLPWDRPTASQT